MIVDVHAHAFPPLAGACGYASVAEHIQFMQTHLAVRGPVVDRQGSDFSAEEDVNFRVSPFGRLEWTKGGKDSFTQWMPPTLQDMHAPPELMIAQMDYIGVDHAILYRGHVYGKLNDYLADCSRRYPKRLTAIAQIDEADAYQPAQIDELRRSVRELGLRGLYFEIEHFKIVGATHTVDDPRFDPLWEEVVGLGIPLVWDISRQIDPALHLGHLHRTRRVIERFPKMVNILSHFGSYIRDPKTRQVNNWDEILSCAALPNVFLELVQVQYPSTRTGDEYPFPLGRQLIEQAYRRLGAGKLVWGSDMPALERACTYRQSLDYIRTHCDFMTASEKDRVLGDNTAEIFRIGRAS
jgi:predicted TIM-barrel fold metal-dependent hydrolase